MSNRSNVLAALALVAVLAPAAASARSDRSPAQNPTQQAYLVNESNPQSSAFAQGRAGEAKASGNAFIVTAAQFAAVSDLPEEN